MGVNGSALFAMTRVSRAGRGRFLERAVFRTADTDFRDRNEGLRINAVCRRETVERCLACEADGEPSDIARNGLVARVHSTSFEGLDPDFRKVML